MSDGYISRREVRKSYRPKSYVMSPGLKRAREPFRVKNAITGLTIAAFCVGVWAYSISAVKQDVFDDLDEEAKALAGNRTNTAPGAPLVAPISTNSASRASSSGLGKDVGAASSSVGSAVTLATPASISRQEAKITRPRGVLAAILDRAYPSILDPAHKTLVWGAPPVEKIGRVSDKS